MSQTGSLRYKEHLVFSACSVIQTCSAIQTGISRLGNRCNNGASRQLNASAMTVVGIDHKLLSCYNLSMDSIGKGGMYYDDYG